MLVGITTSGVLVWLFGQNSGMYGGENVRLTLTGHMFFFLLGGFVGGIISFAVSETWRRNVQKNSQSKNMLHWYLALFGSALLSPMFSILLLPPLSFLLMFFPLTFDWFPLIYEIPI